MNQSVKKNIKRIIVTVIAFFYLIAIYVIFLYLTDYKPEKIEIPHSYVINNNSQIEFHKISILSWNISFAGMSNEMDSYTEGGKKVRPDLKMYEKNLNGILNTLNKYSDVDFMLLQQIDVFSKRSYFVNQTNLISNFLPDFNYSFSKNYDIQFVLTPVYSPLGRVKSGLMTLSKYKPIDVKRIAFKTNLCFPEKLLMYDRCFMVNSFFIKNGKKLIIINIQNSEKNKFQLRQEMNELKKYALKEYKSGNYVVIGGSWGLKPPNFSLNDSCSDNKIVFSETEIHHNFMPYGWSWKSDFLIPTKRMTDKPYNSNKCSTTLLDYFLLSPNIELFKIENIDLDFEFSDHNPVMIQLNLK